jgi:hypothetical protein
MDNTVLYAKRFDEIKTEVNPIASRYVRIFNHYLAKVNQGMSVNVAIDRATRDLAGDNYHPTKPQHSGFGSKQED